MDRGGARAYYGGGRGGRLGVLRLLLRLIGLLMLAGAFAAAVLDGARTLADQKLEMTPLGSLVATLAPAKFQALPAAVSKISPKLWDPVLLSFFYVPTFLVLVILGLILIAFTRKRREPAAIGERR